MEYKIINMVKNYSRKVLCFAPLNEEDAPQNPKLCSAIFYKFIFLLLFLLISNNLYSQPVTISYAGNDNYILTERTDLRRYDNNKYVGLTSREVKSFITPSYENGEKVYDGLFYVEQDTKHLAAAIDEGIHDAIVSVFKIDEQGNMSMLEDNGCSYFRRPSAAPRT